MSDSNILPRDQNHVTSAGFENSLVAGDVRPGQMIVATGRIKVDASGGGTGTVTEIDSGTGIKLTPDPIVDVGTIALVDRIAPIATLGSAGQLIRVNAGATALEYFTSSGGGVTSVVGTTNRISVNSADPANPVVDIASAYVGQNTLTTLGTVTTGTWSATTIALNKGGTGQTTKAAAFDALSPMSTGGDIIYGGASGTGTRLANGSAGQVLTSAGTTLAPTWTTITTAGLTVGTSTITSGTNTRILYDNSGVLGEYTITGSGTVVAMQTAPTFLTSITLSASNIITDTTTGTKIGTATNQKLGFFNSAPIVQPTGDVITALQNLGLGASLTVAATTITSRTLWGQTYDGSANVTGSLTAVGNITGGASSMTIQAGTGASRTLTLQTTTSGSAAQTNLTLNADQTSTFAAGVTVGGTLALGSNSITMSGSIGVTGTRVTKGWFTDIESTNVPTVGGTALPTLAASQTFTGQDKFNNFIDVNNAVTVSSNAGTVPVTFRLNTFTNSSAATMAITMATASAVDGQMTIVRIYDFSGVAQTIGWTNTENSTVSVPTTSNGSATLPLTVGFMYNSATTKWRCIASA